jgi:NAD(P)-dependent dehydrogenase (short-subunit alcohol dehydrogenase family)
MGRTVLITGSNRGIGLEVARQLTANGCKVFLAARSEAAGKKAAESLQGDVHPLVLDVASPDSIRAAVERLAAQQQCLDVLVNNAGILLDEDANIATLDPAVLEQTLETNAFGPLRVSQAFLPLLKKSTSPRIINVSSAGGQLTGGLGTWAPAYCISKTTLNAVSCQLAAALPSFAVNAISPGWVRTDMGGTSAPLSVEEGADVIVWLATDAPQSLTGKFLRERKEIPW